MSALAALPVVVANLALPPRSTARHRPHPAPVAGAALRAAPGTRAPAVRLGPDARPPWLAALIARGGAVYWIVEHDGRRACQRWRVVAVSTPVQRLRLVHEGSAGCASRRYGFDLAVASSTLSLGAPYERVVSPFEDGFQSWDADTWTAYPTDTTACTQRMALSDVDAEGLTADGTRWYFAEAACRQAVRSAAPPPMRLRCGGDSLARSAAWSVREAAPDAFAAVIAARGSLWFRTRAIHDDGEVCERLRFEPTRATTTGVDACYRWRSEARYHYADRCLWLRPTHARITLRRRCADGNEIGEVLSGGPAVCDVRHAAQERLLVEYRDVVRVRATVAYASRAACLAARATSGSAGSR